MKKKDIIKLVDKVIKENTFYGNREQPSQLSMGTKVSVPTDEYPFSRKPKRTATGMMEGDALIDSGIEAYKKILKISPNNSLKGAYAQELKRILGNKDTKGFEFENIEVDNEGIPTDLSAEQAIALTRVTKDVRAPHTFNENNMKKQKIKEYGSSDLSKQILYKVTSDDGSTALKGFPSDAEAQAATRYKNIAGVERMEENPQFTNDIGKDDYMDDEGRFAKSQMHKMAHYAEKLSSMLHDMDQLPAWVQSKITKASDYMSMVYHYLEYEFARKNDNLMEHVDKYNKRATLMEGAMKKFFKMFELGKTDEEIVQEYAKLGTQVPEAFVSKARKQYEGLKKMKLELDISEKEFRNSATKMVNNAEEGMEPVEEKQLASGLFNEGNLNNLKDDVNNDMQEAIKAFKEGKEGANLKMIAQEYNLNEIELENAIKKLEEETVINNK